MALAKTAPMRRTSLALVLGGALGLTASGHAAAGGAWLPGGGQAPIEQRVAVSVGPDRTTLWTSLRFSGAAGAVGVVVPVPPLSAIDVSSDAWLEALEVATAPRVFPPGGISPYCPGEPGDPDPFHFAGKGEHEVTLSPSEVVVLPDAGAVALWAASAGLALSGGVATQLAAMQGKRFLAVRFATPGGAALTRTLRIAMPGEAPALPLALTRAAEVDLLVTTWLIGAGRGALPGSTPVIVEGSSVTWSAGTLSSDYEEERMSALAGAPAGGAVLECAGHEPLGYNVAIGGTVSVDGVATTYFERADAYGNASGDPAACTALAAAALASSSPVSASCPRADHGVVDGPADCVEAPSPGETDPNKLRCGPVADDLAIALSGLTPSGAWLTRYSLRVGAGQAGADWPLAFGAGAPVAPVLTSGSVSLSDCGDKDAGPDAATTGAGGPGSSTSGGQSSGATSPSGGAGAGGPVVIYSDYPVSVGCGCSGTADTYIVDTGGGGSGGDYVEYTTEDDGCGSDTTETSYDDDGCGSDTTETSSSDDGCSGDTAETGSGDSCDGGDTSSDGCGSDSGGSSDGCSGDSGGSSGCSGDSGGSSGCSGGGDDCSIAAEGRHRAQKRRMPRLSAMVVAAVALLAPMRRIARPKRRAPRA